MFCSYKNSSIKYISHSTYTTR